MCDKCEKPVPCRTCGRYPEIVEMYGMFYVKCYNCGTMELALKEKTAIENWNKWNVEDGKRTLTVAPECYSRRGAKKV